jgi:glycosyltransferase involved in cell wall biosynthesis
MSPILSIITVSFNSSSTIKETLDSLQELKRITDDVEIIIKDGVSTDDTMNIVKQYDKTIDQIFSLQDKGIYDAMNFATAKAKGLYTVFINSDDIVNPIQMKKIIDHLMKTKIDLLATSVLICDLAGKIIGKRSAQLRSLNFSHSGMPCSHQGLFVKTSLLKSYRFDESFKIAADYDLILKLISTKASFENLSFNCSTYRLGGKSYGNVAALENFRIQSKYIGKLCAYKNYIKEILSVSLQSIFPKKIVLFIKRIKGSQYDYIQKDQ